MFKGLLCWYLCGYITNTEKGLTSNKSRFLLVWKYCQKPAYYLIVISCFWSKWSYSQRTLKVFKLFFPLFTKFGFKQLQAWTWIHFEKKRIYQPYDYSTSRLQALKATLQEEQKDFVQLQHCWESSWVSVVTAFKQITFTWFVNSYTTV